MAADLVLATEIEGLRRFGGGTLTDVYEVDHELLLIATDRVAVLGQVLPAGIPVKGRVISQLGSFWFDFTRNVAPSHFVSNEYEQIQRLLASWGVTVEDHLLAGRTMLVNRARPIRVDCTVCGYLCGPAWEEYRATGTAGGEALPAGLLEGERLPQPRFLPRRQGAAPDERLTWEEIQRAMEPGHARRLVEPGHAPRLVEYTLALYAFAEAHAREQGLILAETTFTFGVFQDMTILIDGALTPDTSRYWDAQMWRPGGPQPDFAYQFLFDTLQSLRWTGEGPHPELPEDVVQRTRARLVELHERLTGMELI